MIKEARLLKPYHGHVVGITPDIQSPCADPRKCRSTWHDCRKDPLLKSVELLQLDTGEVQYSLLGFTKTPRVVR